MTQIIKSRPPNFDQIVARFRMAERPGVIFAYAPHIYAPGGNVPPELVVHENVHIERQHRLGVENWWRLYLEDRDFRYKEELLAHRAEYRYLLEVDGSRASRRRALKSTAQRLAHALYEYGGSVTVATATEDLQHGY